MSTPKSHLSLLAALLAVSAASSPAFAVNFYWGQTSYSSGSVYTGTAATAGNWYTDLAGTTVATAAPDSIADNIIFNTTPANAVGGDVTVGANISINSITSNTSGVTRLVQSGSQSIFLGSGGITLGASSGAFTIGTGNFLNTRAVASQTWTNNSSNLLTVRSLTTDSTNAGPVAVTLKTVGSGGINFSANIGEASGKSLSIEVEADGGGVTMFGAANTYSGNTTIKTGTLTTSGTLGSGAVFLGDNTGSTSTTLHVKAGTFTNNTTVLASSSGTKTIITNAVPVAMDGTLILNDSVTINTATAGTFNGVISGTGSITKTNSAALTFAADNTFSGDLTISTGAFTLADGGSLTFYIGANGVSNQVNGATAGAISFDGDFNVDVSGAALADGNTWTLVSVAANEIYGAGFSVAGFSEQSAGVWVNGGFSYSESSGVLSYSAIPEPASFALLGGFGTLLFAIGRRRQVRAPAGV